MNMMDRQTGRPAANRGSPNQTPSPIHRASQTVAASRLLFGPPGGGIYIAFGTDTLIDPETLIICLGHAMYNSCVVLLTLGRL
jgi:hypothetical protein